MALKSCSRRRAKAGFFGRAGGVPGLNGADGAVGGQDGVLWVRGVVGPTGTKGFAGGVSAVGGGQPCGIAGDGWGGGSAGAGLDLACVIGLGSSRVRCRRSSSMVSQGGRVCTGKYFLKN